MASRTVTAVYLNVLPAQPNEGPSILHRLHAWLVQHASAGAVALVDGAAIVHAACCLRRPSRLTRVKQAIRKTVCRADDILHVEPATDARAAIARVIDGAGGLAFSPPRPSEQATAGEQAASAKHPAALLLHGVTVQDVLAGRHALWSTQRDAGLLRPLPLPDALEAVAGHVDASCMLPVHHACESPNALAERFRVSERLARIPRRDWHYMPTPSCPLCWRNDHLREELGPGHVRAAVPALYAAGYDAGHLLLRRAEHGLARAVTDLVRELT